MVIRNSSTLGSNSGSTPSSTAISSPSTLSAVSSVSSNTPASLKQQQCQTQKSSQSSASFSIRGNNVTLIRNKKAQKPCNSNNNINDTFTTTKLGSVLNAAAGPRFLTGNKAAQAAAPMATTTATTTYLRLTNANNNNSGNNKNHNSSRLNLNGCNVESKTASNTCQTKGPCPTSNHLTLADVQLKHDKISPSSSTAHSVISGPLKPPGNGKFKTLLFLIARFCFCINV